MNNDTLEVIRVDTIDADGLFDKIFQIRKSVFVEELEVGHEEDYDGFDHISNHYLVYRAQEAVATGRWRRVQTGGRYRIERIAVRQEARGVGVGRSLIERMLEDIPRDREIFIHVPVPALGFFSKLGFSETGFVFEEAGISHKKMVFQVA